MILVRNLTSDVRVLSDIQRRYKLVQLDENNRLTVSNLYQQIEPQNQLCWLSVYKSLCFTDFQA